jgi:hypothetical protein
MGLIFGRRYAKGIFAAGIAISGEAEIACVDLFSRSFGLFSNNCFFLLGGFFCGVFPNVSNVASGEYGEQLEDDIAAAAVSLGAGMGLWACSGV